MIGPLPQLYRVLVIASAVLIFIGAGIWLAHVFELPLPFGGVGGGTAAGALIAFALVHDFSHHADAKPLRVQRRR